MSISLYSAASGMEGQQMNLNVISNNIANVNTTGFKKSKVEFQDMFYQTVETAGAESGGNLLPTGIQVGSGTQVVSTAKVFTQGQVNHTGEKMDIAINGEGFLQVDDPNGGTLYTRDGALKIGPDGEVLTSQGYKVKGLAAVSNDVTSVSISESGLVTFFSGVEERGSSQLKLAKFNNPSGLHSLGGNLYQETDASGAPLISDPGINGLGTIQQGDLETSNVNIVEEMVNMILAQRAYEINSKSIQTSDQMMQQVSNLT